MKLLTTLLVIAGMAGTLVADTGSIEITGTGESSAPPEFTEVSVQVISLCYDSSRGAQEANAALANRIVDVGKRFSRGPQDKVIASGGANLRQTEYTYPTAGTPRVLCERKWRTSNTIQVQMAEIASVPDLQDELLKEMGSEAIDPSKTAQTYMELSQPSFHLYKETHKKLRTQSQERAFADAREQLEVFKKGCTLRNLRLQKVSQPQFSVRSKYADHAASASTPIIPDELAVNAVWKFEWEFDPTPDCAR